MAELKWEDGRLCMFADSAHKSHGRLSVWRIESNGGLISIDNSSCDLLDAMLPDKDGDKLFEYPDIPKAQAACQAAEDKICADEPRPDKVGLKWTPSDRSGVIFQAKGTEGYYRIAWDAILYMGPQHPVKYHINRSANHLVYSFIHTRFDNTDDAKAACQAVEDRSAIYGIQPSDCRTFVDDCDLPNPADEWPKYCTPDERPEHKEYYAYLIFKNAATPGRLVYKTGTLYPNDSLVYWGDVITNRYPGEFKPISEADALGRLDENKWPKYTEIATGEGFDKWVSADVGYYVAADGKEYIKSHYAKYRNRKRVRISKKEAMSRIEPPDKRLITLTFDVIPSYEGRNGMPHRLGMSEHKICVSSECGALTLPIIRGLMAELRRKIDAELAAYKPYC